MKESEITAEYLRSILDYNPETGVFRWRVRRSTRIAPGMVAGHVSYHGYYIVGFDKAQYKAHRLAWLYMTGEWPKQEIDHINGERANNRWINLREATSAENNRNACMRKDNTSGYRGVYWHKVVGKWRAQIRFNRKVMNLGFFNTPEEASAVYEVKAAELFGDFKRSLPPKTCVNALIVV